MNLTEKQIKAHVGKRANRSALLGCQSVGWVIVLDPGDQQLLRFGIWISVLTCDALSSYGKDMLLIDVHGKLKMTIETEPEHVPCL